MPTPAPHLPAVAAWLVVAAMVVAAVIDGRERRVPNWLTVPLALCGLSFWAGSAGGPGLAWAALGWAAGLVPLFLIFWIGGMGAGDAKFFGGVGAWFGPAAILWALGISAIVGGALAVAEIARTGRWRWHARMAGEILRDLATLRRPAEIAERADRRKPQMHLLPYGVPLTIGSIGYFAWAGMLS